MQYRIGQAARHVGMSVEGLRFYERKGLVRPASRSPSGYRLYSERQMESLRFVRAAQEMGFSLREIRDLLGLREGVAESCQTMRANLQGKLDSVLHRIELLRGFERELVVSIARCDAQMNTGDTTTCPVLADLGSGVTSSRRRAD